jgi:hypothetical protein
LQVLWIKTAALVRSTTSYGDLSERKFALRFPLRLGRRTEVFSKKIFREREKPPTPTTTRLLGPGLASIGVIAIKGNHAQILP